MAIKDEKSWKQLFQAMIGTIVIWTLSNFGVILLSLLLTGTVDYITWAFFWSGLYGCGSTCMIYVVREKLGYLGAEELASVQATREEVDQAVFDSTRATTASEEHKQYVEDVAKGREIKEEEKPTPEPTINPKDQEIADLKAKLAATQQPTTPAPVAATPEPTPAPTTPEDPPT